MTKIKAPLFSLYATGTLDKNITYKNRLHNHIAQKYSKPGDKNPFESSPRQKDQRSVNFLILAHWQSMSPSDKLSWENAAKVKRFKGSGYHYFRHMAQKNLFQYLGLVGFGTSNYNVGDTIYDLSGNENHNILKPSYPSDCPTLVDSYNKKNGKAISFDGLTQYSVVPQTIDFLVNNFTAVWNVKSLEIGNHCAIIIRNIALSVTGTLVGTQTAETFYYRDENNHSVSIDISGAGISDGHWHHVAGVREGTEVRVYFDGEFFDSKTHPLLTHFYFGELSLGRDNYGGGRYYWKGLLDNIILYNRALSSEEIKILYSI
jgi:hypothetical protein